MNMNVQELFLSRGLYQKVIFYNYLKNGYFVSGVELFSVF